MSEPMKEQMDHRAFLISLSAEERARLNETSDAIGLTHLCVHWGLIGVVGSLILMAVPGWQALLLVQGILLVFLFTLLHETVHLTPFKTPILNTVVGYVCGFVLFLPANWFRYFHLAHHRHTQDPDKDPELASPKPETWRQYLTYVSGLPVMWWNLKAVMGNAMGRCDSEFVPKAKLGTVTREARIMLALYGLIAVTPFGFDRSELLYVWIIPLFLGQPFLRLYLLAEHGRCAFVANMFENTRTTFTHWIVRKLAWNMPYHAEHHACPTVPFHRLQDVHELVKPHLVETENGYSQFHKKYVGSLEN